MPLFTDKCFNPFRLLKHRKNKNTRRLSKYLVQKWGYTTQHYACDSCRKRLLAEKPSRTKGVERSESSQSPSVSFGNSEHTSSICDAPQIQSPPNEDQEILKQLKEKFDDPSTSTSMKTMILTIAPKSWSENKLAKEFGTSRRQAAKAKQLVDQFGVMSSPNPRGGRKLPIETESLVRCFYLRADNSRVMPGAKDFISVKSDDGKRMHIQKQLLMCNIDELYQQFKKEYPNVKVGVSKFFTLRPKQCILADAPGTHMVCVCAKHQNVKLMLNGGNIANLTAGTEIELRSYKDCLRMMMCHNPTQTCHLMTRKSPPNECCKSCPGLNVIRGHLKMIFDDNQVTEVLFENWLTAERCTISTHVLPSDDFVDTLCDALESLKPHAFISDEQARYFKTLKESITEGEIVVQCDFAENYSFVVQDAAQSFHWNNDQATLLTSVFYYREGSEVKHGSIVMISDDLKHDTSAFYAFQKILHKHLLAKSILVSKIIYITDGAPQHFKNKFNFVNLFYYKQDFNADAEIHFHATSHGKGPCDGVGGNLKRLAKRASLQLIASKAITSPEKLYNWAKSALSETALYYCSKEDIESERILLRSRFDSATTIPGTKTYHAFIPKQEGIILKRTSSCIDSTCKIVKIVN